MLTFELPQTLISAEPCVFEKRKKVAQRSNIGSSKVSIFVFFWKIIWYYKFQEKQLGSSKVTTYPSARDSFLGSVKRQDQRTCMRGTTSQGVACTSIAYKSLWRGLIESRSVTFWVPSGTSFLRLGIADLSNKWVGAPNFVLCKVLGSNVTRNQDTFDRDKGQKSATSEQRLHWNFESSSGCLPFCPGSVNLVRRSPQMWRKSPDFQAEKKSVESCHISGCHGFLVLKRKTLAQHLQSHWFLPWCSVFFRQRLVSNARACTIMNMRWVLGPFSPFLIFAMFTITVPPPYTGVYRSLSPEILKKSRKGLPAHSGCQESVKKGPWTLILTHFWLFFGFLGTFSTRFWHSRPEGLGRPFGDFWGISGPEGLVTPVCGGANRNAMCTLKGPSSLQNVNTTSMS